MSCGCGGTKEEEIEWPKAAGKTSIVLLSFFEINVTPYSHI
jgi:hypothetical protein